MTSKRLRIPAVVVTLALTAAACGDDGNDNAASATTVASAPDAGSEEPGTIVDVAVAAGDFTTLVAAVEAADLVETLSGDGPFTVLAPTDAAFADALSALGVSAEELLADTELLTSILTYHVLAGEVPSTAVVELDGQSATTLNGAAVDITVEGDTVMVNRATVTAVDIPASNGIIHVIDSVLLPPDVQAEAPTVDDEATDAMDDTEDDTEEVGTIVDVAAAAGDFTTLVAAVEAADLVETLSGEGPFTVLAPTDDAFAALLDDLGVTAEELLADTELLTSVLTYHVISGEVPSTAVVGLDGQTATTVNGAEIEINVEGDTVMVNDATVIAVDIPASNGIIHVIDTVLLPPS